MNLRIHLAGVFCLFSLPLAAQSPDAATVEENATTSTADQPPPPDAEALEQVEEVVVTATKRAESARTLAGAVTAVSSERLAETGSSNLADYLSFSPGVNLNTNNPGVSVVTIRGVSTDTMPTAGQSAVGIYYDDIPLTDPGAPVLVPDIDAYDAKRIEVLRGPQGALYGSSSLGGALNYIPEAPDASAFDTTAQFSGTNTKNADTSFSARLMGNAPLIEDKLALRVVGTYVRTPGWIDNIGTGVDGANDSRIWGGRAMLGWNVAPGSNLRVTGLYQKAKIDDAGFQDSGDLKKNTLAADAAENDIAIGAVHYDLETEGGTWSVIAGYQDKSNDNLSDQSAFLGLQAFGVPFMGVQSQSVEGYSGELRFASKPDEFFEYLVGVSYADRDEEIQTAIEADLLALPREFVDGLLLSLGITPPDDLSGVRIFDLGVDQKAPEAAAFVDTTFHLTPSVKLSAGGRFYRNTVDADIAGNGILLAPSGNVTFSERAKDTATGFNPRVSLAWQIDPDAMVYALYSRGYRLGGVNLVPDTPISNTKVEYGSDEVNNYELGTKTRWLDGILTVDVTGFYIDWKDIPLQVQDSAGLFKYLDNVGDAEIYGVETSLAVQPTRQLALRSSATYNKATLQNFYDPQNGRPPVEKGDRLPGAPAWTLSNTLTGRGSFAGIEPVVTLIHRYESESPSSLSFKDVMKGGFHQFDVRAGATMGAFTLTVFGRNLADKRGATAVQPYARAGGGPLYVREYIITPRTFGAEVGYTFGG